MISNYRSVTRFKSSNLLSVNVFYERRKRARMERQIIVERAASVLSLLIEHVAASS